MEEIEYKKQNDTDTPLKLNSELNEMVAVINKLIQRVREIESDIMQLK